MARRDVIQKAGAMMKRMIPGIVMALVGLSLFSASNASGTMEIRKRAKEAGFEATSCTYCHNEKLPKKGAATHNDRGKFLVAQKAKLKATEVDVNWLKDYKEPEAK
jgi:hypothetical protein